MISIKQECDSPRFCHPFPRVPIPFIHYYEWFRG